MFAKKKPTHIFDKPKYKVTHKPEIYYGCAKDGAYQEFFPIVAHHKMKQKHIKKIKIVFKALAHQNHYKLYITSSLYTLMGTAQFTVPKKKRKLENNANVRICVSSVCKHSSLVTPKTTQNNIKYKQGIMIIN